MKNWFQSLLSNSTCTATRRAFATYSKGYSGTAGTIPVHEVLYVLSDMGRVVCSFERRPLVSLIRVNQ
jgi:hypothetical protein